MEHRQNSLPHSDRPHPSSTACPLQNQGSIFQLENTTNSFHILTGNWRNTVADPSMRRARIAIIPSYNESLWMWNMHRDNGGGMECTHFCHPSVPQVRDGGGWCGVLDTCVRL